MATGFLHIDGNSALRREAATPHHWLAAFAAVILAQWIMWQGSSLGHYAGFWAAALWFEPTTASVVSTLFFLLVPTAIFGALTLYVSHRFDGRSARALGLDASTPPLALVWALAGLIAAAPHAIAIMINGPVGAGWLSGVATLLPVTIIQAGAEEILFRGVILGLLCARYGVRVGVLVSALLFGFWHLYLGQPPLDAFILFTTTFVFGLTSAVVTLHYANLGPALGLHVIWNVAGYLSAAAGHGPFWNAWVGTFSSPWTLELIVNGEMVRTLIIPLLIETLIVFAACRSTVLKVIGSPPAP